MKVEGPRPTRPSQAQGGALDGASSTPRRLGALAWRRPSAVAPGSGGRRRRPSAPAVVAGVALGLGVVVQLLPLLLFPTVLSQDGPAHVAGAWVLLHVGDDDATGAVLAEHYRTDLTPVPNMLATLLLAGLLPLAGPDGAERLLVAGLVLGLVGATLAAVRALDRRRWRVPLGP